MPSQINLQITGKIGNIIFYKRGDKYYARSVSGGIKQTKATKKRATEFGKASRAGKILRQQLLPVIPFPADNKMQTRLVSDLFSWLRSGFDPGQPCDPIPVLNDFSFTEGNTIAERWRVPLEVTKTADGMLQIKIPAFVPAKNIVAPAGTVLVKCHIATGGCDLKIGRETGGFSTSLNFNYNQEPVSEQIISLPTPTLSQTLIVAGVSLEYYFNKNGHLQKSMNKAFMPAGIVKAMYL
ncbi:hypothetical protein EFY79_10290 [Hanamia caeni]|jgi:hypothetical protein|uniref:Uncharacterized protein n=1 Tax=Hanamia caeni TaxID=2294116 RepID=A0A3M9NFZ5_9BACT|nr:hypothetical protein [Hanamia caeni]RNI36706.1 hypothetical protein EFY79_10290 [Hanamia caeni]